MAQPERAGGLGVRDLTDPCIDQLREMSAENSQGSPDCQALWKLLPIHPKPRLNGCPRGGERQQYKQAEEGGHSLSGSICPLALLPTPSPLSYFFFTGVAGVGSGRGGGINILIIWQLHLLLKVHDDNRTMLHAVAIVGHTRQACMNIIRWIQVFTERW